MIEAEERFSISCYIRLAGRTAEFSRRWIPSALVIGERVKVTLRPEIGLLPNPMEGQITLKDELGNFSIMSEQGVIQVKAGDILSITRLQR